MIRVFANRCCVAALVVVAGMTAAWGEVSVRTDAEGNYRSVHVLPIEATVGSDLEIWASDGRGRRYGRWVHLLNTEGDRLGDSMPAVIEAPRAPFHPTLVWNRPDASGESSSLVWSRWTDQGWTPVQSVNARQDSYADEDPVMIYDLRGRLYMAWMQDRDGRGRIMFSVFTGRGWTAPMPVSKASQDASEPNLSLYDYNAVGVTYESDEGPQHLLVVLPDPVTITDDFNPYTSFQIKNLRPRSDMPRWQGKRRR